MFSFLAQIVFTQPFILSALLALPVLWYILRITPPAPKKIFLPTTRFLHGLVAEEQTPSASPWWLLLLRLLMVALLILALSRPIINPSETLAGQGGLRLVIDNDWASAQSWDTQISAAEEAIAQAARAGRDIYILPTTPLLGEVAPVQHGPLAEAEAISILRGLSPQPWNPNYSALYETISKTPKGKSLHSLWLSHGLDLGDVNGVVNTLQRQGGVEYVRPNSASLPLLLRPDNAVRSASDKGSPIRINLDAPKDFAQNATISVQAITQGGNIVDIQSVALDTNALPQNVRFEIPEGQGNDLSQFKISGRRGAGSIYLLDDQFKKRHVGIAGSAQGDESAPLIEETYYIRRALEPSAKITMDDPAKLIAEGVSVMVLPDVAAMTTETLNSIENWVKGGGLLLRFAGPNMADLANDQFLLPVQLRAGGRSLSGALTWDEPQKIEPFAEDSPFYGLDIPIDIQISQQILADPAQDLENKVWARLSDGTPFITAAPLEKGMLVLIHTTANTDWSDFALSGLYVSVLKRIVQLAGTSGASMTTKTFSALDPLMIMDGYGGLISPPAAVNPISAKDIERARPSSVTPPGIYGNAQTQFALNIGEKQDALVTTSNLPLSVTTREYKKDFEIDLMPYLLYAAILFFALDWLIMMFMLGRGLSGFRLQSLKGAVKTLLIGFVLLCIATPAMANEANDIKLASGTFLAYVKTGNSNVDSTTERGLTRLSEVLTQRTSVEPEGVVSVDPEKDDLSFFPLIYWAVTDTQKQYSDEALENIQNYLDQGGTILFDTRDQNRTLSNNINSPNAKALRRITSSLNIPPIAPIPQDHVLGRSYYLLDEFPGRYSSGTLWLEQQSLGGRDNVSSVLIGSNDWAGAWADSRQTRNNGFSIYSQSQDTAQEEQALRFGVNLMMYALTGNYKADQVHIPHILERLGR